MRNHKSFRFFLSLVFLVFGFSTNTSAQAPEEGYSETGGIPQEDKEGWFNYDPAEFYLVQDPLPDSGLNLPRLAKINTHRSIHLELIAPSIWCEKGLFYGFFCPSIEEKFNFEEVELPENKFLSTFSGEDVVVVVHGYATTLEDNRKSMNSLVTKSEGQEKFILYRWPSAGSRAAIVNDLVQAQGSAQNLAWITRKLMNVTSSKKISIVAHSMGARVLQQFILAYGSTCSEQKCLGGLVFFNPNLLKSEYREMRASSIFSDVFLYVHRKDAVMEVANKLEPGRLISQFDSGKPFLAMDLETIDMTLAFLEVDSERAHSGWYDCSEVIRDLEEVLGFRTRKRSPVYLDVDQEYQTKTSKWTGTDTTAAVANNPFRFRALRATCH